MKSDDRYPWAQPIFFEGVELPLVAIGIDHLGLYDNLPELSESASLWLWRFAICRGRIRTDQSETILTVVDEVLEKIGSARERLIETIPGHWVGPFDQTVINEWVDTLQTIGQIAAQREKCTWTSPDPTTGIAPPARNGPAI